MDRVKAARLLREVMVGYAQSPRAELELLIGETDAFEIGDGGERDYQVEVNAFWDDQPGGTIRVVGSIDDGGFLTSFKPVTDGFLVAADGTVDMPGNGRTD